MYLNRKKKSIISIIAFIAIFAVLAWVVATISGMGTTKNLTGSKFNNSAFTIGSISETTGKSIESKQNIALKEMYKLEGSEIKMKDDASVSVKVFFYDEDGKFISATDLSGTFVNSTAPETSVFFRLVITPAQVDGEPVTITTFNMNNYINQISVVVAK